jgi:hypothetical protein
MGKIKSALELALERTDSVAANKSSIGEYDARKRGMVAANKFLDGAPDAISIADAIKNEPEEVRGAFSAGLGEILLARINLPYNQNDLKPLEKIGTALALTTADPKFSALYKNFLQTISKLPLEYKQYDEGLRQQYAPQLAQKEDALSRQYGYAVKLDAMQDPEFVKYYNQNMTALKQGYEQLIEQIKFAYNRNTGG